MQTDNSTIVLKALPCGISLAFCNIAIPIPGITKIGKERTTLVKAVLKTAALAHSLEVPNSSSYSSYTYIPFLISPIRMNVQFRNPAVATAEKVIKLWAKIAEPPFRCLV